MFVIWYLMLAGTSALQVGGTNIMLNKPSVQSGTWNHAGVDYFSSYANDGSKTGYPSTTVGRQDPYWQGDLQDFYTVTRISVTSTDHYNWAGYQQKAIIGVSVNGVGCSKGEVTRCGQWPDEKLMGHTIVFNCSHAGPVRYVRIWREIWNHLTLGEVEVEGEPSRLTGTVYDKIIQQKVISPNTSVSVRSKIGCGVMCSQTQLCLAFSYSASEQPNCLLATNVTMTSDVKWVSFLVPACN